jgi:hypothetical protein
VVRVGFEFRQRLFEGNRFGRDDMHKGPPCSPGNRHVERFQTLIVPQNNTRTRPRADFRVVDVVAMWER